MLDDDDDGHRVFSACTEVVPKPTGWKKTATSILRVRGGSSRVRGFFLFFVLGTGSLFNVSKHD